MTDRKRSRFTERQIIGFIEQSKANIPIKELCRNFSFSNAIFNKSRAKFGGMEVPEAKHLPAEVHLDIYALNTAFR